MNFQQKNVPDVSYARHFVCGGEKKRDYLEDGAECGGRVVGGGVWIAASGKIEFEASRAFCAVLCLVSHPFQMGGYAGGYGPGYACTYRPLLAP